MRLEVVPLWGRTFVRVADHPLGGAARLGERPFRMTTSFIIHYVDWQAARGFSGHLSEMGVTRMGVERQLT
jgi:hypothetical protein